MPPYRHYCDICKVHFTRKHGLTKHNARVHTDLPARFFCDLCHETFVTHEMYTNHKEIHRPSSDSFSIRQHSARGLVVLYEKHLHNVNSVEEALRTSRRDITDILNYEILQKNMIKASIDIMAEFTKTDLEGNVVDLVNITLHSAFYRIFRRQSVHAFIRKCQNDIFSRVEDFTLRGSNWTFRQAKNIHISIGKMKDLVGGCEGTDKIKLNSIQGGKFLSNPPSSNNECFYACIAHFFTKSNEVSVLDKFISKHITKIGEGPVAVKDIARFERANKNLNVRINVVLYETSRTNKLVLIPLYNSKNEGKYEISLLLYEHSNNNSHYILINDFNKFARTNYGKGHKKGYSNEFFCHNCLCKFSRESTLKEHYELCKKKQTQKLVYPSKGDKLFFKEYNKTYPHSIVMFADFESGMEETDLCEVCNDFKSCTHNTTYLNRQEAIAFSIICVDIDGEVILDYSYAGENCVDHFLDYLMEQQNTLMALLAKEVPGIYSAEDNKKHYREKDCCICGREINSWEIRVRHHNHYNGKLIGIAHQDCNLNCKKPNQIVVYVHNLTGYDSALLIPALGKRSDIMELSVMPYNTEKVRMIKINNFKITDSLDLLHSSLAQVTEDLVLSNHNFPILEKSKLYTTLEQRNLLLRKGVFPYSFAKSAAQLSECKVLPPKEAFYSDLAETHISDDDYEHARHVYDLFCCQNMTDYMLLYVKLDVYLLAESVIKFRKIILEEVNLDCVHYLSSPQLAFSMMLKITKARLDHITDPTMTSLLEENIRGKLS